jgi:hypothetical protein
MPIESQTIDGRCVCRISGGLNIWEAAAVWERILPLLSAAQPLIVDLSAESTRATAPASRSSASCERAADNHGHPGCVDRHIDGGDHHDEASRYRFPAV